MCEQVSVGVCDWGWFAPAESHHRWAISVPVTLSPLSDPCSVCGRRLRSVLVPRFLSAAASWTPIAGPWLPIASLRYLPQPYGKLRFCLRRAPLLPTEAPPLPYGKLRLVSRCVLLPVINSLSATESSRLHCDNNPSPKPKHHSKLSAFYSFNHSVWFISLFHHGDLKKYSHEGNSLRSP